MLKEKRESSCSRGKGTDSRFKNDRASVELTLKTLGTPLIIAIVLLSINFVLLVALLMDTATEPTVLVIETVDDTYLDSEDPTNGSDTYGTWVRLQNTGGKVVHVGATGEILVSL